MSTIDFDSPSSRAAAANAGNALTAAIKQADEAEWDRLRRWAAVAYINYLTRGIVEYPILDLEPTVKVAWLSEDQKDLIVSLVSHAMCEIGFSEQLEDTWNNFR